jgi:peptidoglycan/xylan/chitin deacetylase (PgdA/CDA1 family)
MKLSRRVRIVLIASIALAVALVGVGLNLGRSPARAGTTPSGYVPLAAAAGQTVVSIEFDDGLADELTGARLLASHQMHGTFYINSGTIGTSSLHMTWPQVRQLAAAGDEIAGHTIDHQSLAALEAQGESDEARREICDDRSNLLSLGFHATDFAYPYGASGPQTEQIVRECGYNSARDVSGISSEGKCSACPFAETIPPGNPYDTKTPENILARTSLKTMQSYVTQAQRNGGGWVQLVFHHVCSGCGQEYAVTAADLDSLLGWLERQPGVAVDTVQQVIGGPMKPAVAGPPPRSEPAANLLHNPSLEEAGPSNVPACWDVNSYGSNHAVFARVGDAHAGRYAERIELKNFANGGAELTSHFDMGDCAPSVQPGHRYTVSLWFHSDAPVLLYMYTRNALGSWSWWANSPPHPRAARYTHFTFTTPPLPASARAISVGLGLGGPGSVTVDDYTLTEAGS